MNVQTPFSRDPPGVIIALSHRGTSHMRENLFLMGRGCEKYAKLQVNPLQ